MTTLHETPAEVGKARVRKEDARLITGQTNWTDNIALPGLVHVAFVRSPYAHARITSVDLSAAREAPGVFAAYSGADFAAEQGSLPCAWPVTTDIVIPDHPSMAVDTVRYGGEIVACVVARDQYAAADAVDLVDVTYEALEPVMDMEAALSDGSPKVHMTVAETSPRAPVLRPLSTCCSIAPGGAPSAVAITTCFRLSHGKQRFTNWNVA